MKKQIVYVMALICTAAAFVGWRVHALRTSAPPHLEIVEDLSLSHPDGCRSLLGLAEEALRGKGASPGSMLSILVVGDEATGNEPWQLGIYSIPSTRKAIEGRAGNVRRQREILRDISDKCRVARRTNSSPIFLAVKQAVADLHSQGCGLDSRCELFVDSDLEENLETSIRRTLDGSPSEKRALPARVDNDGIDIAFCGEAVTVTRGVDRSTGEHDMNSHHSANREGRLRQTWFSLFTVAQKIRFEPYCPQPEDLSTSR